MLNDLLFLIIVLGFWYALMRYILPALGISTCMTGACQSKRSNRDNEHSDGAKNE